MNRVARALLLVGVLVLVLLIGILMGRRQPAEPAANTEAAATAMQIKTTAPPPVIQPLPPPPPPPMRAQIHKLDPAAQVSADAAAVGMTTTDESQSNRPESNTEIAQPTTGATAPTAPTNDDSQPIG